jgi:hypothetical protein
LITPECLGLGRKDRTRIATDKNGEVAYHGNRAIATGNAPVLAYPSRYAHQILLIGTGGPRYSSTLTREGAPFKLRLGGDFEVHPTATDMSPTVYVIPSDDG